MLSPTRTRAMLLASGAAIAGLLVGGLSAGVSHAADNESCRPDGLYKTAGVDVPYCSVYDTEGREKMGADHQRRVIGYFTGWRTGKNGQPSYLVNNIPWDKITHINYAFAHVGSDNKISVGADGPTNEATGMTWPGVAGAEMDPSLPYKGHFNLLTKYKKQHPDVKTLISVGGWAETGGYFGADGKRVAPAASTAWPPTRTAPSTRRASTPSPSPRSTSSASTGSTASTSTTSTRPR